MLLAGPGLGMATRLVGVIAQSTAPGKGLSRARTGLTILFVVQACASVAFAASLSLNSIVAFNITGQAASAGVPATANQLGAAASAMLLGQFMTRYGRRLGLSLGLAIGAGGALLGFVMAAAGSFPGFIVGSALVGVANAAQLQARYAAADLVEPARRGTVVGGILFGSVIGALIYSATSPLLSSAARTTGIPWYELSWLEAAGLAGVGALLILTLFRARPESEIRPTVKISTSWSEALRIAGRPEVRLGVLSLVVGQAVMVMLMVLIPLHAERHGAGPVGIANIITLHQVGMFGFAWLSGLTADRLGPRLGVAIGGVILIAGSLTATSTASVLGLGMAMLLIGLGWNFCFVVGTTLLARYVPPAIRPRFQGLADVLVWLAAGSGSLGGGVITQVSGFATVAATGAVLGAILLAGLGWLWLRHRVPSTAEAA